MSEKRWNLVGEPRRDDKILEPERHRAELEKLAPELATILNQGMPKAIGDGYQSLDQIANEAREQYKKRVEYAVRLAFGGALCGALAALYEGLIKDRQWFDLPIDLAIIRLLFLTQILLLLASAVLVWFTAKRNNFGKWRTLRADAEHSRITLFLAVIRDASEGPLQNDKALQQALSYLFRHLYWSQLQFFYDRSKEHEAASERRKALRAKLRIWAWLGIAVVVAIAVLSVAALLVAPGSDNPLALLREDFHPEAIMGALGIAIAAILAAAHGQQQINQDEDNARRYRETAVKLRALGGRWDEPNEAFLRAFDEAGSGSPNLGRIWAQNVVDILCAEHKEWRSAQAMQLQLDPLVEVMMSA
jgi:hypothetical protein